MDIAIIYMVAGLSSRFGGKIKQFARVGPKGETLIEYSLNQAIKAGFSKIIFIVGNKTEKPFKEIFGNEYKKVPVYYALQQYDEEKRDRPWGTVGALCSAKDLINCPFIVCNGDDIYGEKTFKILVNHLKNHSTGAAIGYKISEVLSDSGGVNRAKFEINQDNMVSSINETFDITKDNLEEKGLDKNSFVSQNIFALHPEILEKLNGNFLRFKEEHKTDRKIECLLPQEINNLIQYENLKIRLYPAVENWLGITNPGDEKKVKKELL